MKNIIGEEIGQVVADLLGDYNHSRYIDRIELFNQPNKEEIISIVDDLLKVVYPGYYRNRSYKIYNVQNNISVMIEDVAYHLNKQIHLALEYTFPEISDEEHIEHAQRITIDFLKKIPDVRAVLETDLEAAFQGDPAAKYREEVLLSYPGMMAITVNRLAHELFLLEVPLIPRIMTEYAHSITGIDIHPGATIGRYFFIDHGTGVVIGETTVIGERVKIYQGVTLGALSTKGGQKLKGVRRHPTIGDDVTIYAGASILGGESVIGKNSVIGSNVFITTSIPEGTRVSVKNQELKWKRDGRFEENIDEFGQNETWC
ncbi:MAG: serine acetyltransferase [Clostridiales bacterium]|nr:serine acetyltransferase [Clostridiales bacterium]